MNEVAQNLFVGTADDASDDAALQNHDIAVVVSLIYGGVEGQVPADITHEQVPLMDGPQNSRDAFETAVNTVLSHLNAGEKTLVHCSAGASRSPTVAATALAFRRNSDFATVFEQVRHRRPETDPHDALIRRGYDVYQRGEDSLTHNS